MAHQEDNQKREMIYTYPGMHVHDGMVLPEVFPSQSITDLETFQFRHGDVVVDSYPKSGTLWLQEIIWWLHNSDSSDDVTMDRSAIIDRVPSLDVQLDPSRERNIVTLKDQPSPRLMKSHLPAQYFTNHLDEGKVKVIYLIRNVKDALVSCYNFYRMAVCFGGYSQGWDTFYNMFLNKELAYGDWFDHVLSWWNVRHSYQSNLLIVTYEELQRDPVSGISRIARFCNVPNTTREYAARVAHLTCFDQMKRDPNANRDEIGRFNSHISPYMRKGKVGGWKQVFTVKQNKLVDAMVREKLTPAKLNVEFEL